MLRPGDRRPWAGARNVPSGVECLPGVGDLGIDFGGVLDLGVLDLGSWTFNDLPKGGRPCGHAPTRPRQRYVA